MYRIALVLAWLAGVSTDGLVAGQVVPAEGPPSSAALAEIDHDWQIVFVGDTGRWSLPADELVRWGAPRELLRGPVIVLADGGLLAAEPTGIDETDLAVDSALFGPISIPLDQLAGIVFRLPTDLHRQTLLFDRLRLKGSGVFTRNGPENVPEGGLTTPSLSSPLLSSDRIVLENGDELTGLIERLDLDRVRLRTDTGPIEAARRTIAAVIFNPALRRPALAEGLYAWTGLSDGSLVQAARIALDERMLAITGPLDQTWKTFPDDLVFVQPMGGRVVYLSAMEPKAYRHVPYLELQWPYRTNRNVVGGRLRCAGRTYLTGLGMYTASRLTYRLDGAYQRFLSEVGVDDSTGGRGSVRFRVFVDGREQFTSRPIRGGEPPQLIDLNVTGAKQLDLAVDFAERAHVLGRANWIDARLVRSD